MNGGDGDDDEFVKMDAYGRVGMLGRKSILDYRKVSPM